MTKTTLYSLDVVYKDTKKFVNVERELKSSKSSLVRSSDKLTTSKKKEEIKPFIDKHTPF